MVLLSKMIQQNKPPGNTVSLRWWNKRGGAEAVKRDLTFMNIDSY